MKLRSISERIRLCSGEQEEKARANVADLSF
jgi:hypothetical protein